MELQSILDRLIPANVGEQSLMHVEDERLFVRILGGELYEGAVGDDLFDHNVRVRRVELKIASEGRHEDVRSDGLNVIHMLPKETEIGSLDDQPVNADQQELAFVELDSFEHAAWGWEMSSVISTDRNQAVAGFGQALDCCVFGEGQDPDVDKPSYGNNGEHD